MPDNFDMGVQTSIYSSKNCTDFTKICFSDNRQHTTNPWFSILRYVNDYANKRPATKGQAIKHAHWVWTAKMRLLLALKSGWANYQMLSKNGNVCCLYLIFLGKFWYGMFISKFNQESPGITEFVPPSVIFNGTNVFFYFM